MTKGWVGHDRFIIIIIYYHDFLHMSRAAAFLTFIYLSMTYSVRQWTEHCSELYNYKASGDTSVLNCPQINTEDDYPILRREVEAAVQSLKKGKSAGVDNVPAELVQAGGEDVITALTTICNKIWQTGEWPTPGPSP